MTIQEMTREIEAAEDARRIATLHWKLNHMGLSRDEYLALERMMTARMYDGSMTPLQPAVQFSAYL
jgi:hypothetical protein